MISYKPLSLYFSYIWKDLSFARKVVLNLLPMKLFLQKWNIPDAIKVRHLFTQSMNRKDYNEFVDRVFQAVESKDKNHIILFKIVQTNFDVFLLKSSELKTIWQDIQAQNIFEKIFIFLNIVQVVSIQKQLREYEIDILVTHADIQPIENYIVQYFKSKGTKTVTMQHGLYIDYARHPNINEVNYKNVVSDYFFAWGEETKELIKKYHPKCEVLICGNPMVKETECEIENFFTVVFDQELFKEYNKSLIHIAQQLSKEIGLKILLKPHPKNNLADYDLDNSIFVDNKDLHNSVFVLGHTTTLMFQLMRNGIAVYKYQTELPSNKFNDDLVFHDLKELMEKLNKKEKIDFRSEGSYYIKYVGTDSLQKYKNTLEELAK